MALHPIWITDDAPPDAFPDVEFALLQPNGLIAVGGDLCTERLLCAYRRGIFPWYGENQPILWWSPNPRTVFEPGRFHVSKRLARRIRSGYFEVTVNTAFDAVVAGCAAPRSEDPGTWITGEMAAAYASLHRAGKAHSVECWRDGKLVGGVYGVALGAMFYGESMFSRETDASKVALAHLVHMGFAMVDCQLTNPHLLSLGARELERVTFCARLDELCIRPPVDVRAGLAAARARLGAAPIRLVGAAPIRWVGA